MKAVSLLLFLLILWRCSAPEVKNDRTVDVGIAYPEPVVESIDKVELQILNTFSIYSYEIGEIRIGMSPAFGRVDFKSDLVQIKQEGVTTIISLLTDKELSQIDSENFEVELNENNITLYHLAMNPGMIPSIESVNKVLNIIDSCTFNGETVLLSCKDGVERSGIVMACYLSRFSKIESPMDMVKTIRGEHVEFSKEQEGFIKNYIEKNY